MKIRMKIPPKIILNKKLILKAKQERRIKEIKTLIPILEQQIPLLTPILEQILMLIPILVLRLKIQNIILISKLL